MNVVRCDGCQKIAEGDEAKAWLRLGQASDWGGLFGTPGATTAHACSWECVGVIALQNADLFASLENAS